MSCLFCSWAWGGAAQKQMGTVPRCLAPGAVLGTVNIGAVFSPFLLSPSNSPDSSLTAPHASEPQERAGGAGRARWSLGCPDTAAQGSRPPSYAPTGHY